MAVTFPESWTAWIFWSWWGTRELPFRALFLVLRITRSAVLAGDMKYLLVPDRAPQFYNVADDPQEQRDLYFSRHQNADSLAKKLGTYLTTTPACRFPDSISWSAKLMREYDKTAPDRQPE